MTDFVARRFGENLRHQRALADITQEELGFRASVHRTEVGELERGSRIPQLDTILKLAGGLAVQPCQLIAGMIWASGEYQPPGSEEQ